MAYYGTGDYYASGGFFGSLLGRVARGAVGLVTGGPVAAASGFLGGGGSKKQVFGGQVIQAPGVIPMIQRAVPGGATGLVVSADGTVRRRRRKMNYANGKALTRANRRVDGFVRLAKRSLKHTNYKIVSKSAGRSRSTAAAPIIVESGPGSVRA